MTEAILIEIAQRFGRLEDKIEADVMPRLVSDDLRYDLETLLEACWDDMTAMQERIRRTFDPGFPRAAKSIP